MIIKTIDEIQSPPMYFCLKNIIPGNKVYLKLEGLNPAGSIKFVSAQKMINGLEERKILDPSKRLIESSSGNLGVALSILCRARGYPFYCVIDPNILPGNEHLMSAYGAKLLKVTQRDENGGFLGTRIKLINQLLQEDPNLIWVNQYENLDNPRAHYEKTAAEILAEFPDVDYLFVGAGTTGTLMGCAQFFKRHSPKTKIIAVDVDGSVTFGKPSKPRFVPGLGTSKRPPILDTSIIDELLIIEELAGVQMCREILNDNALLTGGSTGIVLAAVRSYQQKISPDATIVAISPDFGNQYIDSVYSDQWVESKFSQKLSFSL